MDGWPAGRPLATTANPAALTSGLERLYAYTGLLQSVHARERAVEAPVINGIRIARGPPQSRARTHSKLGGRHDCPEDESVKPRKRFLARIMREARRDGCLPRRRNKTGAAVTSEGGFHGSSAISVP
ncbi:hypothetical protein MTO96_008535 [Rhipicephalus appendiculatus]